MKIINIISIFSILFFSSYSHSEVWTYNEQVDPMSDKKWAYVIAHENSFNARLSVSCLNDSSPSVSLTLNNDIYIKDDGFQDLTFRIDSAPPRTESWMFRPPSNRFISIGGSDVLFSEMRAGKKILFRVEDYRGRRHLMEFSLMGLTDKARKLKCVN